MISTRLWRPTMILGSALALTLGASTAYAVSSAAALYLRIPVGARPAGMGEAYVAVADDATATRWNPAGLGAAPLSGQWMELEIPSKYQPISRFAAVKRDGGAYEGYDLWAYSPKGLIRYREGRWSDYASHFTTTEEDVDGIIRRFTQTSSDSIVARMASAVGDANNTRSREALDSVSQRLLAAIPVDHAQRGEFENMLQTLAKSYDKLLVNWSRVAELEGEITDAREDEKLSPDELDKLNFTLEKCVRRYLPEEIILPYSLVLTGNVTGMATTPRALWVGTDNGLLRFQNETWTVLLPKAGDTAGLPSGVITCLTSDGSNLFVGTDKGLASFFGITWQRMSAQGLPEGRVNGVAFSGQQSGWAVVDGEMYHFNGSEWRNWTEYTVGLDETAGVIAGNFAIYNTAAEGEKYLGKLTQLNSELNLVGSDAKLTLGDTIKAPIVAEIKGDVTCMYATSGKLLVGTEQGLLSYTPQKGWTRFGYRALTLDRSRTVTDIALEVAGGNSELALTVASKIREQNDLQFDTVDSGATIWVYRNLAGSRINDIGASEGQVFIATAQGTVMAIGDELTRYDEGGVGSEATLYAQEVEGRKWFATSRRLTFHREASRQVALMYSKWLPELAPDLFYSYASLVMPVRGAGTMGISFSYMNYGVIQRTDQTGNEEGVEKPNDLALGVSYGAPLGQKTAVGATVKFLWSHLASAGAGAEKGKGDATGVAVDLGLLHKFSDRFQFGAALTNFGPKLAYIDAQQADNLPINMAVGFAWKAMKTETLQLMAVGEGNYILVEERFEPIVNGGLELNYAGLFAARAGYIYDNAGDVRTPTVGVGMTLKSQRVDFSYNLPSGDQVRRDTYFITAIFTL